MSQHYSDPSRESEPYALPDVETFYLSAKDLKGIAKDNGIDPTSDGDDAMAELGYAGPGWYYWSCSPGCLPDSDPIGPVDSEELALEDVRS